MEITVDRETLGGILGDLELYEDSVIGEMKAKRLREDIRQRLSGTSSQIGADGFIQEPLRMIALATHRPDLMYIQMVKAAFQQAYYQKFVKD